MSAPESVVRAVEKALGCRNDVIQRVFGGRPHITCQEFGHSEKDWTDRGCPLAVTAADAAWVAARHEALLEAAERAAWEGNGAAMERFTEIFLRHMAAEAPK